MASSKYSAPSHALLGSVLLWPVRLWPSSTLAKFDSGHVYFGHVYFCQFLWQILLVPLDLLFRLFLFLFLLLLLHLLFVGVDNCVLAHLKSEPSQLHVRMWDQASTERSGALPIKQKETNVNSKANYKSTSLQAPTDAGTASHTHKFCLFHDLRQSRNSSSTRRSQSSPFLRAAEVLFTAALRISAARGLSSDKELLSEL